MSKLSLHTLLEQAVAELKLLPGVNYQIETPPRCELGDYATNLAIIAAKKLGINPLELANQLAAKLKSADQQGLISKINVAPPGFINFFLSDQYLQDTVKEVLDQKERWGRVAKPHGPKVLLEFVSANPTGPLHVGHGRWAVVGDVIGRLLAAVGCQVDREYYVNDEGNQVAMLYRSVLAARQGEPTPENGYGGAYIKEVRGTDLPAMLEGIICEQKGTLEALSVAFDRYFRESELHHEEKIKQAIQKLNDLGQTYKEGGALWFSSREYGDDKDRVLVRADGETTYFAADIAYHLNKYERGYDLLIDIWGTDHHGYINRLKAALQALNMPADKLEIIIGQLVTLYRGAEPIRMSKRTGEMITLQEVIDEIGADAVRFFFSATDVNSHLDFDLELAKKRSLDNPVYYLQYAHARICSILRKNQTCLPAGKASNIQLQNDVNLSSLTEPAERTLMLKLLAWPDLVLVAAKLRHPHRLTEYGKELATVFHSFYEQCRVLGNPARLALLEASRITLRNVLELLGISAPESM